YMDTAFISSVEQVPLEPEGTDAVALQVTHGETVDTIISTLDEAPFEARKAADVTIRGRLGIVRRVEGRVTGMWLFEGTELQSGDHRLDSRTATYEGEIIGEIRVADDDEHNAFITSADLPEGDALHGVWMIVTHPNGFTHGYEIQRVEKRDGQSLVILTMDHGLQIDGETTREVYYPQRTMEGTNTFTIPLAACMVQAL
ncbi:MAG: hypothetical protein ACLFWB_03445, partial [Armatimonadota bacterium]